MRLVGSGLHYMVDTCFEGGSSVSLVQGGEVKEWIATKVMGQGMCPS